MTLSLTVPIKILKHHVHLSLDHAKILFGDEIAQQEPNYAAGTGNYRTDKFIDVVGPKGEIHNVAVVEPYRDKTQVEISQSAAIELGLKVPLKDSGDLEGTPGAVLIGPMGTVAIGAGVIIPNSHVHLSREDAQKLSLSNGDRVNLLVQGLKKIEYQDILVRVEPASESQVHLGFDEANAAIVESGASAVIRVHNYPFFYDNDGSPVVLPRFADIKISLLNKANCSLAVEAINFCTNIFEFTPAEKRRMTNNLLKVQRGESDDYFFLVASDAESVIGVTSTYYLPDLKMAFMEFIAVAPHCQRRGLGSYLYYQTLNTLSKAGKELVAMVFEVRSTRDGLARRKEFFLNLGAVPINLQFYPIGHKMDPELMLMLKPMSANFCLNTPVLVKFFSSLSKRLMEV